MNAKMEQYSAINPNPVLGVVKNGTVNYSNEAGKSLLQEWSVEVGGKLPSYIGSIVQRVLLRNSPEKMEVKVGKRAYLVMFQPLCEEDSVNIYGFDISDQKEHEQKLHLLNEEIKANSREIRKLNEALLNSESKFWHIIENTHDGIWIIDRNDRTIFVNQKVSEMLGYSIYEICGHSPKKFLAPKFRSIADDRLLEHRQRVGKATDYRFIRKDGSDLWCIVSTHQLLDDEGKNNGSLGLLIDITERKKAEEALKESHDILDEKVKERTLELEKAYASLKESEERLAEAQKMAHVGNWEWDIAIDKAYWSDETYRIFNRDPQELAPSYNEYLSYIHPDDLERYCNAIKTAEFGSTFGIDYRIVLANGEERKVHLKSEFVFDDANLPTRIKGTVQDITERKKAEEKIHHLANIVESSSDAIGTLSLDGIVTSWNKGAEQIYGYSAEEILGKPSSIVAPSHLSDETKKQSELIKQGESIYHYETLRVRKDGKKINVSITLSPVFDSYGKLTAISFISRDITEQKKSEEKLRESEEKYRNIVETANEGIIRTDNESVIIYVNKKMLDMLGYSLEEAIGRTIWGFICGEYKPIIKMNLERKKQGISESGELKLIHKDGSHLWTHMNSKPLFDMEGKYMGAVSMITDITKRKEAEQALSEMEIAREKGIHHRIKNNLQVISSLLDLQADIFRNRENIKGLEVLEAFRESRDRVISMALIHEELYRGREFERLSFAPYVEELAENIFQAYNLGNNNISLKMNLEENIFFDMDVAVPLGMIINELVSNSLKLFTGRDQREIRIILQRDKRKSTTFTLSVSDNGVGIPKDLDIDELNSLGLQLVTYLVDQLDGELELKRDNGTEFIIRFTVNGLD